ncbi:hypothetical protein [Streptomyces sp. NPDC048636]|uniref:hypothetical protein n=1 Tax=Streptomyces sp. NPDC048636 TaxID=3155762 RepID=UPI00341B1D4E
MHRTPRPGIWQASGGLHRERRILRDAWARDPSSGPTDAERELLAELRHEHRVAGLADTDPLPMLGAAQLFRRDIPDLRPGPDDCDLLQAFWCPFDRHGRTGYGMSVRLLWRRSWEVTEVLPGWRAGGFASRHVTDPARMDCASCAAPMELLLTIDSSEWDGGSGSWIPVEERDAPSHLVSATPTEVTVGRWGELNIFACPADPGHPHRWSLQQP